MGSVSPVHLCSRRVGNCTIIVLTAVMRLNGCSSEGLNPVVYDRSVPVLRYALRASYTAATMSM